MPNLPSKSCTNPSCPNVSTGGRCDTCRSNKSGGGDIKKTGRFYGGGRWKKMRAYYGNKHPLCELCLSDGTVRIKNVIDHIHEIKDGGEKYHHKNLMSLCTHHHNWKTKEMDKQRKQGKIAIFAFVAELRLKLQGNSNV